MSENQAVAESEVKLCACGARLRSDNRTGVCRQVECRREYWRVRKNYSGEASYLGRDPRPCRECGQQTRSAVDYCQRNARCMAKYKAAWERAHG